MLREERARRAERFSARFGYETAERRDMDVDDGIASREGRGVEVGGVAFVLQAPEQEEVATEVIEDPEGSVESVDAVARVIVRDLKTDVAERPPRDVRRYAARRVLLEDVRDRGEQHVEVEVARERVVRDPGRRPRRARRVVRIDERGVATFEEPPRFRIAVSLRERGDDFGG